MLPSKARMTFFSEMSLSCSLQYLQPNQLMVLSCRYIQQHKEYIVVAPCFTIYKKEQLHTISIRPSQQTFSDWTSNTEWYQLFIIADKSTWLIFALAVFDEHQSDILVSANLSVLRLTSCVCRSSNLTYLKIGSNLFTETTALRRGS